MPEVFVFTQWADLAGGGRQELCATKAARASEFHALNQFYNFRAFEVCPHVVLAEGMEDRYLLLVPCF